MRRSSLFSRKFALSRKAAALSLPPGRQSIRQDAEGFDDLDEYFANSPLKVNNKRNNGASIVADPGWSVKEEQQHQEGNEKEQYSLDPTDFAIADMEDGQDYNIAGNEEEDYSNVQLAPNEFLVDLKDEDNDEVPMKQHLIHSSDSKYISDDDHEVVLKSNIKITPPKPVVGVKRGRGRPPSSGKSSNVTATQTPKSKRSHAHRLPTLLRELKEPLVDIKEHDDDLEQQENRRSRRQRMAPLAFWRNEKVIYGRRQSAKMPVIVDVLRKGDSLTSPTKQHSSSSTTRRTKSKKSKVSSAAKLEKESSKLWVECEVMDYDQGSSTDRLIAMGPTHVNTSVVGGENFSIQTIFTEGSFLSAGILEFPPNSSKPSRNSSKHVLIFFVGEGYVEVTVNESTFIAGPNCQFIVPRGNHYSVKSAWNEGNSRLFFCHCKANTVVSANTEEK